MIQILVKRLSINYKCLLLIALIVKYATVNCKSVSESQISNKWIPIKEFKSLGTNISHPASSLTSNRAGTNFSVPFLTSESINIPVTNQNQDINPSCVRLFKEQLLQILSSQNQNQKQVLENIKQHLSQANPQAASNLIPTNAAIIRHSRDLRERNANGLGNGPEEEDEGNYEEDGELEGPETTNQLKSRSLITDEGSQPQKGPEFEDSNDFFNKPIDRGLVSKPTQIKDSIEAHPTATAAPTNEEIPLDEMQMRKEQEAIESSEAEAADRSALDEQQQQQREIIQAQAEHEARAIKEQQELLLKQQKLQQQMIFMRDRNDQKANHSQLKPFNSIVNRLAIKSNRLDKRPSSSQIENIRQSSSDIQFSDQSSNQPDTATDESVDFGMQQTELKLQDSVNMDKLGSNLHLIPSDTNHHHYGAHFGSLHKHQSKYYQYAESHKKGQYKAGFKRGGKKFKISGHSSQHKSHAEGHVKWKGKKGKGSHHWDYKHKPKKHHHHHYHY